MEDEKQKEEEPAIPKLIELVDRLEKANAEAKEIQKRNEELFARNLLGGKTDAGVQPAKPIEQTPKEYANNLLKGILPK